MSDEIVKQFISYFKGRSDCYGDYKGYCVKEALTPSVFERHLTSNNPKHWIGVYCLAGQYAGWGCIDIDGKDFPVTKLNPKYPHLGNHDPAYIAQHDWDRMWQLSRDLHTALEALGIASHIERSRNGYHVWVFPERVPKAATMRRALLVACQIADYTPKEVNPKQEGRRLGTKGLGNFVRLPYGGGLLPDWEPTERYMVGHELGEPASLYAWLGSQPERASSEALEHAASLWVPPPEPERPDVELVAVDKSITDKMGGKTWTIYRDGPMPGADRSGTLARLAYGCAEDGLEPSETFSVLVDADARWGKFYDRPDRDEQLMRFVERAHG